MANMYMVSCRREFWSANDFSTADEIRHLDLNGTGQARRFHRRRFWRRWPENA